MRRPQRHRPARQQRGCRLHQSAGGGGRGRRGWRRRGRGRLAPDRRLAGAAGQEPARHPARRRAGERDRVGQRVDRVHRLRPPAAGGHEHDPDRRRPEQREHVRDRQHRRLPHLPAARRCADPALARRQPRPGPDRRRPPDARAGPPAPGAQRRHARPRRRPGATPRDQGRARPGRRPAAAVLGRPVGHGRPRDAASRSSIARKDRDDCADHLVALALENGSRDNVSAIVVDVVPRADPSTAWQLSDQQAAGFAAPGA